MSWIVCRRISGRSLGMLAVALAAVAPAGARSESAVTAVTGKADAAGAALDRKSKLTDGDSLHTGEDGACSILMDGDAVLELCQGTSLRLGHRDGKSGGARVLQLQSGEIRVLADPRASGERIEIHTPAAIATILGTVVYVSVAPNGETTIASGEHDVRVESARRLGSTITVGAGRQVTIRPGAPFPRATQPWNPDTSAAGGCLIDFRALAYDASRGVGDDHSFDTITGQDLVDSLPHVSAAPEAGWMLPDPGNDWLGNNDPDILNPTDTGAAGSPGIDEIPPCGGIPGEFCD